MLNSIALLVFCAIAVAHGNEELVRNKRSSSLIVGGTNAGKGTYPEFAIIYVNGSFVCGGTIINTRSILTAAHCIFAPAAEYTVAVAKYKVNKDTGDEQYFGVRRIYVHPGFDMPDNDIAMLRLDSKIVYGDYAQPAVLAKGARTENFTSCYAVGVGATEQDGNGNSIAYAKVVQDLATSVVSRKRCKRLVSRELGLSGSTISKAMLCTQDTDAGVCFGDSGGPVGCFDAGGTFVQMGLLSFGSPVCEDGFNVFTRVSQYKAWIKDNS